MVRIIVEVCSGHAHDKTRGAETALAAVSVYHRLLYRMQGAILRSKTFNGCDVFAFKLWQEQDARVERPVTRGIADHHSTSAAIAFVATFFRTGEVAFFAQPIKERCRG